MALHLAGVEVVVLVLEKMCLGAVAVRMNSQCKLCQEVGEYYMAVELQLEEVVQQMEVAVVSQIALRKVVVAAVL